MVFETDLAFYRQCHSSSAIMRLQQHLASQCSVRSLHYRPASPKSHVSWCAGHQTSHRPGLAPLNAADVELVARNPPLAPLDNSTYSQKTFVFPPPPSASFIPSSTSFSLLNLTCLAPTRRHKLRMARMRRLAHFPALPTGSSQGVSCLEGTHMSSLGGAQQRNWALSSCSASSKQASRHSPPCRSVQQYV